MTNDYISRESARNAFYWLGAGEHSMVEVVFSEGIRAIIEDIPAANVVPVVHARWKVKRCVCGEREFECSACHKTEWRTDIGQFKFCPFCMATMDGGRHWIKTPRWSHLSRISGKKGLLYSAISPTKKKG